MATTSGLSAHSQKFNIERHFENSSIVKTLNLKIEDIHNKLKTGTHLKLEKLEKEQVATNFEISRLSKDIIHHLEKNRLNNPEKSRAGH